MHCTGVIVYKPTANYNYNYRKLRDYNYYAHYYTEYYSGQVSANAVNTDWPLYISIDIMKSEKGLQDEELNKGTVKQENII